MHEKIIISRKNGFSLVSVMVASLILGIGIVSLMRIFTVNPFVNATTDRLSQATNYAQDKIEELRALGYISLVDTINAGYTTETDSIGHIVRRYILSVNTVSTVQVDVRCYWQALPIGVVDTVRLITLVSGHD